jgi:hypothetical protein
MPKTSSIRIALDAQTAWLHFLVCPRRYRSVLPSSTRPNLFAGD